MRNFYIQKKQVRQIYKLEYLLIFLLSNQNVLMADKTLRQQ
jgi:hypothetical protein